MAHAGLLTCTRIYAHTHVCVSVRVCETSTTVVIRPAHSFTRLLSICWLWLTRCVCLLGWSRRPACSVHALAAYCTCAAIRPSCRYEHYAYYTPCASHQNHYCISIISFSAEYYAHVFVYCCVLGMARRRKRSLICRLSGL